MAHAIEEELENVLRTKSFSAIKKYISEKESKVRDTYLLTGLTGVLRENPILSDADKKEIVALLIPAHQPTNPSAALSIYPPPETLSLKRDIRRGGGGGTFKSTKFSTVKITSKLRKYIKRCGYKLVKINKKSRVK
jgi:hypothetical protein